MFATTHNPSKIQRDVTATAKQIEKDRALAAECEQVSNALYRQIVDALPDDRSRDMFAQYSLLISGKHTLSHVIYTDTKRAHGVYEWAVKKARKLLGK